MRKVILVSQILGCKESPRGEFMFMMGLRVSAIKFSAGVLVEHYASLSSYLKRPIELA
jgi:hypothetical protein